MSNDPSFYEYSFNTYIDDENDDNGDPRYTEHWDRNHAINFMAERGYDLEEFMKLEDRADCFGYIMVWLNDASVSYSFSIRHVSKP